MKEEKQEATKKPETVQAEPEDEEGVADADREEEEEQQQEHQEQQEEADFKTKYFYLAAELENQRKRFQRERENLFKFGNEKILGDLIEVIDNLERTIAAIDHSEDKKIKNIVQGVDIVKKQFLDTLGRHGLTPLESLGEEFDPNLHEAMAQEEAEGQEPNKIIRVFEQGYKLNGRLLRAAKVIVAK